VKDQVDACRSAGLAFVWCARASWGKRELARWLADPYTRAVDATREADTAGPPSQRSLEEQAIHELLARSHQQVIALLRKVGSWKAADERFARQMVDRGVVVGVMDHESAIGYGPVAAAGMRLSERVAALFVADFLTRPEDYAQFRICDACEGATFDDGVLHAENCTWRPTVSAPRTTPRRRITLVGLGRTGV
jgi:hypothetical protein